MKKYKRTRIIANLAVMGSLAWSSTTFAATTAPVTWGNRAKDNTNISITRPARVRDASAVSTSGFRSKRERGQAIHLKQGTVSLRHGGEITSVNAAGFTIKRPEWARNASTTLPSTLTVTTSNSTVYMKDGKLAEIGDLAAGQHVRVTGELDTVTMTITATGVDLITEPRKRK
ncbi:MAG: hypothetical protein KBC33_00460 [Candidatus Pacebacteria bacterium]|nr:hypothetical protein [Candidatus Paceibacterota bacterium]